MNEYTQVDSLNNRINGIAWICSPRTTHSIVLSILKHDFQFSSLDIDKCSFCTKDTLSTHASNTHPTRIKTRSTNSKQFSLLVSINISININIPFWRATVKTCRLFEKLNGQTKIPLNPQFYHIYGVDECCIIYKWKSFMRCVAQWHCLVCHSLISKKMKIKNFHFLFAKSFAMCPMTITG